MEWLKEFLKEIENSEELEKKIAEKIKESYVSKGEYDAVLTVKDDLQEQMKQRDKDIEELKKTAGDNTQLQQKYHDLEQKYKTDTQNLEKKIWKRNMPKVKNTVRWIWQYYRQKGKIQKPLKHYWIWIKSA